MTTRLKKTRFFLNVAIFAAILASAVGLSVYGAKTLGYNWQWYRIPRYLFSVGPEGIVSGPLLRGLLVTFQVVSLSLLFSALLGVITAVVRISGSTGGRALARGYIELIRNTPLLIQLFFIYFVFSPLMGLSRFPAAVLALSLFEGAYASEIIRAGILSVESGQWESARSLGFNRLQMYTHIIVPQAVRTMLPPLASQSVSLVKDSALVSTIAIYDLTMRGQEIIAETFLVFEVWFTVGAIYLVITSVLSTGVFYLEKK